MTPPTGALPLAFFGRPLTLVGIVLANLVPAAGVAFLGWDAAPILILYWIENLALGAMTLPRILAASGAIEGESATSFGGNAGTGCFFAVHYGLFCVGHGVFAFILAHQFAAAEPSAPDVWAQTLGSADFLWAVAGVVLIDALLQIKDWWLPRRWREASPTLEMFKPYGRIAVLHIAVLGGAWVMERLDAPVGAVLVLCLGKMALELVILWLSKQAGWKVSA